jgi:signal transduction histidine kinase
MEQIDHLAETYRQQKSVVRLPAFYPSSLEKAILACIERFQEIYPSVDVQVDIQMDTEVSSKQYRNALYRIFLEAMHNIAHHANASKVSILLRKEAQFLELIIEDNGRGFDVPAHWRDLAHSGKSGLVGMQERAQAISSDLHVISKPGEGTILIVSVPFLQ